MRPVTIATWLWRDVTRDNRGYVCRPSHVQTLASMLRRNITVPYRFVCVTDDIIPGVDTVPLPWDKHVPGTVYQRLKSHDPDWNRENLGDRIFSIDVDVVITGNIDHLLSREEDFVIWRNPNFPKTGRAFYQSSVRIFDWDARPQLYDDFNPDFPGLLDWVNSPFEKDGEQYVFGGREQAWISRMLPWDEAYFDASDGVYGAGRLSGDGVYTDLPEDACIVSCPGARAPWNYDMQEKHPWIKDHYK